MFFGDIRVGCARLTKVFPVQSILKKAMLHGDFCSHFNHVAVLQEEEEKINLWSVILVLLSSHVLPRISSLGVSQEETQSSMVMHVVLIQVDESFHMLFP